VSTPPRTIDRGSRVVAGVAVRVTELVWPDERRSYEVHLINGDVDLTEDGCFDDPPTDAQISELLAEYRAATTLAGWATSAGLLRELLSTASTRIGWQLDLDQLPVTCAHTPHLVLALIDTSAAHLAALAAHTALTEAAQSIQTIIAEQDRDTVDWFAAGLLGSIAQLANSRSPQLGHSRRALLAALSALQQEGVAWPPDPTPPTTTQPATTPPPTTQPTLAGPVTATESANNQ
jgi:hypothetical protein